MPRLRFLRQVGAVALILNMSDHFLQFSWSAAINVYDFARYEPGLIGKQGKALDLPHLRDSPAHQVSETDQRSA